MTNNKYNTPVVVSDKVVAFIQYMQLCFPITFPCKPEPKVALMVGLGDELRAWALTVDVSKRTATKALSAWCKGYRYTKAVAIAGSPRYDLHGNVAGEVTADQIQYTCKKKVA